MSIIRLEWSTLWSSLSPASYVYSFGIVAFFYFHYFPPLTYSLSFHLPLPPDISFNIHYFPCRQPTFSVLSLSIGFSWKQWNHFRGFILKCKSRERDRVGTHLCTSTLLYLCPARPLSIPCHHANKTALHYVPAANTFSFHFSFFFALLQSSSIRSKR